MSRHIIDMSICQRLKPPTAKMAGLTLYVTVSKTSSSKHKRKPGR
jgi:hypothetical protein